MTETTITNPILPGFNPDPSICRVGKDYYIAVSTFEWYPGVLIYHSRDLANWQLVARPLDRASLLDLRGVPDSCGVWAPCLSWADGKFWLVYTAVKRFDGNFKDTHNYITTCDSIDGEWNDPVYVNSSGFDPSLFHDDDGRKWYTNMVWDHRPDRSFFRGIVLQEFDPGSGTLLGQRSFIFDGTDLDYTEAPHLYKRDGWYYLITAEGGTSYGHAVTMARSRNIDGPYEADPAGPVVTARDNPEWPLQRAGHADFVETPNGDFYLVHLCGRPLPGSRNCTLGRETAIQKVEFTDDGWLRLVAGGHLPEAQISVPMAADVTTNAVPLHHHEDFDTDVLDPRFQWLRTPYADRWMSLSANPGRLTLYGQESPGSLYEQALIARRQTAFSYTATTRLTFRPEHFQHLAGLICYYNARKFHYLYLSADEAGRPHLGIMSCEADRDFRAVFPLGESAVDVPAGREVWMRAVVEASELRFSWSLDGENFNELDVVLDYSVLSDEAGDLMDGQFTGAFVGMCCNDLTGSNKAACFDFFDYAEQAD